MKKTTLIAFLFAAMVTHINAGLIHDRGFSETGFLIANPYTGGNETALTNAIERLPDGKYLVAGDSTGFLATGVAMTVQKFNRDGSPDLSFGGGDSVFSLVLNGLPSGARGLAVLPDGRIIVAGFTTIPVPGTTGVPRETLVRLNPNGTLDTTFDQNGIVVEPHTANPLLDLGTEAYDVEILPDGSIVTGGSHRPRFGNSHPCGNDEPAPRCSTIAKYTSEGSELFRNTTDFGADNDSEFISDIEIQSDGKIVGVVSNLTPLNDFSLIRLNPIGAEDLTFGTGGVARISNFFGETSLVARNVEIQPDNKILLTGNGSGMISARFNSSGQLDATYGTGGKTEPIPSTSARHRGGEAIVIQTDGKILISGGLNQLIRLTGDGQRDSTFGANGVLVVSPTTSATLGHASDMVLEPDGRIAYASRTSLLGSGQGGTDRWLVGKLRPENARFDFDGDSKTDISVFRPGPGEWWYLRSSDNGNYAAQFGTGTDTIVPADYTGDGKTDVAFFRPSTGEWFVLRSEDQSFYSFPFGAGGDIPIPGDFDGDQIADPAIFRPSTNEWFINNSGGGTTIRTFGASGDRPVISDYDGDGKADIGIYRPTVSEWWIDRSSDGLFAVQFGSAGDKAVPADFTGDGKADIAFWRPSTGFWFVLRSEDSSFFSFPFGTTGDIPVPGDYDGDGTADPALYRPSVNTWFKSQSTNGFEAVAFGIENDVPVPGAFNPN